MFDWMTERERVLQQIGELRGEVNEMQSRLDKLPTRSDFPARPSGEIEGLRELARQLSVLTAPWEGSLHWEQAVRIIFHCVGALRDWANTHARPSEEKMKLDWTTLTKSHELLSSILERHSLAPKVEEDITKVRDRIGRFLTVCRFLQERGDAR
jgi:hypothetical protein